MDHACRSGFGTTAGTGSCPEPVPRARTAIRRDGRHPIRSCETVSRRLGGLAGAIVLMTASAATAEVEFTISPEPYFVGAPLTIAVKVINEPEHETPAIPEIEGADVRDAGTSTQQTVINLQVTRSVTYQYEIIPRRPGRLVIPPIEIMVKGKAVRTDPNTLEITRSDSGDRLFVEVRGNRESLYLGESVELTLDIWIKPYIDRRHNFGTSTDMQSCIDFRNSTWGPFGELLQTLRRLPVRRGRRADADGVERDYYVYHLTRTLWPEKSGRLNPGKINITVQYPLQIERDRTFFFTESRVNRARPISVRAEVAPILVKPIPTEGRPPGYNGAVGPHEFVVTAKPTEVHVGDPITLTMSLTSVGPAFQPVLDLLQPPKLDTVEPLVQQFKIPDEMLAGAAEGSVKRFTQTIRARSDSVEEIPAIPFTYFDTESEQFVTIYSNPILIRVAPSERLAIGAIVESETGMRVSTRLTRRREGILANYTRVDDLLSPHAFAPGREAVAWIASPPVLLLLTLLIRRRRARLRHDVAYTTRRAAKSTALRSLKRAATVRERTNDPRQEAAIVLGAVTQYVANRCGLPSSSLTRAEAVELLRCQGDTGSQSGVAEEKIRATDALLEQCEGLQYAGSSSPDEVPLSSRARRCIAELEKERF